MVYPFARHADGTTRKWVAGTDGVRSKTCGGFTANEGPCDVCQQLASDKELLRLMHVALGGHKKPHLTLLGSGLLIDRCRELKRKNERKRLMAMNAIRDVSRLDKCVSDHKQLASALAHPNCPPRAGRVLSSLLQQSRSVPHCLEMLQRGYRAKYVGMSEIRCWRLYTDQQDFVKPSVKLKVYQCSFSVYCLLSFEG